MAGFWLAPTAQALVFQLTEGSEQIWLFLDPLFMLCDDLCPRAIDTDTERIAPLRSTPNVDVCPFSSKINDYGCHVWLLAFV
jgi:hypothetical protein